jgi:basic membrane protein A
MNKKLYLVLSLILVATLALSACAPKEEAAPAEEVAPAEEADPAEESAEGEASTFKVAMLTDLGGLAGSEEVKGFSDLGWDALKQAESELGVEITLLEAKELADLEPNLIKMASEGYDVVVGVGFLFTDAMTAVAPQFPDTKFIIVDSVVDQPNVASLVFAEEQGSFLVGAIAAGMSQTGTIGFIGGMESALIEKFEAGYIAGARAINPDIVVLSGYTGSFTDVAAGKELSLTQYGQGADIIYAAAGSCGLGTIEAAKENGFYAIGVDTNQDGIAPGSVLTSMLKHVEVAVFNSIKGAYEGNFVPGITTYDLSVGGVGYSPMEYTKDAVPAELLTTVDGLAQRIINGEIVVPTTVEEANAFVLPE